MIATGDFNLPLAASARQPSRSIRMPEEIFLKTPQLVGLISGPTTVGSSSYDHILYFKKASISLVRGSARTLVDIDTKSESEVSKYKTTVSDHFPIMATFVLN